MLNLTPTLRHPLNPSWGDTFYPDDLPPEWRLEYYANEFRSLVATPGLWQSAEFAEQCAELGGDFALLLELDPAQPPPPEALHTLAPHALCLCLHRAPPAWLESIAEIHIPLCLFSAAPPDVATRARIAALPQATLSWWEGSTLYHTGQGPALLAVTRANAPRPLRDVIDAVAAAAQSTPHSWLLLEGEGGITTLRTATQLAAMMGY